jgi:phage-related tail fiber protein
MELRSNLDAGGLIVFNLDASTNDSSAAATVGRVSTVESNLSASISTLESQFQAAINNLDIKTGVRVAATTNIDIATGGLLTIQGVTLAATDRVLLTAQTDATENGIYVVAVGVWVRSGDADTDAEVTTGMAIPVAEGDTANRALWILGTPDAITLGTTELSFQRSRNLHDLTLSGGGLNLSGSYVLSLIGTTDRVSVSGTGIDIAAGYVGQSSITTVGTVATGTWSATEIAIGKGGTGATSAAQARLNLGVAEEVSQLIGNGSSLEYTVTHNLNNESVMVSVTRVSDKKQVSVDVTVSANTVVIGFSGTAPATDSYKVAVLGVKKA